MKNFINIKDISSKDLRKILDDAKKRKNRRKNLNTLDIDKDKPLHGKLLLQSPIQDIFSFEIGFFFISSTVKTSDRICVG